MKQQQLNICIKTCADPGIFVRGVEGGSRSICHIKITDNGFLVLFSNPPLILQNANGLYNFQRFQRGFDIFFQGGGPTFLGGDPIAYPL